MIPLKREALNRRTQKRVLKTQRDKFFRNVSLFLPMERSVGPIMPDASLENNYANLNGEVLISSVQKKYGKSSCYFDGFESYLIMDFFFNFSFDFTIEGWVYRTGSNAIEDIMTIYSSSNLQPGVSGIHLYVDNGGTFYFNDGATGSIEGGVAPLNKWAHFAAVRKAGVNTLYVDGVSVGTSNQTFPVTDSIHHIGAAPNYAFYFQGYIDNFRMTQLVARYTGNFFPERLPSGYEKKRFVN